MTIDERITKQLGRRKEMQDRINQWEKPAAPVVSMKRSLIALAIAACIAIVFILRPFSKSADISPLDQLGIEQPLLSDFRAANPTCADIDLSLEQKDYDKAIVLINESLKSSSEDLKQLEEMNTLPDETILYEKEIAIAHNYQLRWARIYTLVRLGRCEEAIEDLKFFVTLKGDHSKDAKALLKLLTQEISLDNQ